MFALYKFELRKINSRKIVWITGCVMLVGLLILGRSKCCSAAEQRIFRQFLKWI